MGRALKNNPDLIYEYVHNNIEIVWMYGSHKGPLGTLIDKSGTAFDQAELMAALLTQAGYDAAVEAGTITLGGSDFAAWSNISDATSACQLLANGGIPAKINGQVLSDCSFGNGTAISSVILEHAWVKVVIGGTAYMFDPSFKAHGWKTGMNLATASGYSPGTPFSTASTGMSAGTDAGNAKYASHLDGTDLNSVLSGYANNLIGAIQTQGVGSHMEDIVGGGTIVPYVSPAGGLRQTALPYQTAVQHDWDPAGGWNVAANGYVAAPYRNTLQVTGTMWNYITSANDTMFNITFFTDEITGRALTVDTDYDSSIQSEGQYYSNTVTLKLDGQKIPDPNHPGQYLVYVNSPPQGTPQTTSRGSPTTMTLHVDHPYAAPPAAGGPSGSYMDTTITKDVVLITPLTIVAEWGAMSARDCSRAGRRCGPRTNPRPMLLNPPNGWRRQHVPELLPGLGRRSGAREGSRELAGAIHQGRASACPDRQSPWFMAASRTGLRLRRCRAQSAVCGSGRQSRLGSGRQFRQARCRQRVQPIDDDLDDFERGHAPRRRPCHRGLVERARRQHGGAAGRRAGHDVDCNAVRVGQRRRRRRTPRPATGRAPSINSTKAISRARKATSSKATSRSRTEPRLTTGR